MDSLMRLGSCLVLSGLYLSFPAQLWNLSLEGCFLPSSLLCLLQICIFGRTGDAYIQFFLEGGVLL